MIFKKSVTTIVFAMLMVLATPAVAQNCTFTADVETDVQYDYPVLQEKVKLYALGDPRLCLGNIAFFGELERTFISSPFTGSGFTASLQSSNGTFDIQPVVGITNTGQTPLIDVRPGCDSTLNRTASRLDNITVLGTSIEEGCCVPLVNQQTDVPGQTTATFDLYTGAAGSPPSLFFTASWTLNPFGPPITGVYLRTGTSLSAPTLTKVADTRDTVPGTSQTYTDFQTDIGSGGDDVVFVAETTAGLAVVARVGGALELVGDYTSQFTGLGNLDSAIEPSIADGRVIFRGTTSLSSQGRLFSWTLLDGLEILVEDGTPIAGTSRTIAEVTRVGGNWDDDLVFTATDSSGDEGIYAVMSGSAVFPIVEVGDQLGGKTVDDLSSADIEDGLIAFNAAFTDGSAQLYYAEACAPPAPGVPATGWFLPLLVATLLMLALVRLRRRQPRQGAGSL